MPEKVSGVRDTARSDHPDLCVDAGHDETAAAERRGHPPGERLVDRKACAGESGGAGGEVVELAGGASGDPRRHLGRREQQRASVGVVGIADEDVAVVELGDLDACTASAAELDLCQVVGAFVMVLRPSVRCGSDRVLRTGRVRICGPPAEPVVPARSRDGLTSAAVHIVVAGRTGAPPAPALVAR
jgi:hypothetical protein